MDFSKFKHLILILFGLISKVFCDTNNKNNNYTNFTESTLQISNETDNIQNYILQLHEIENNIQINERKLDKISKFRLEFVANTSPNAAPEILNTLNTRKSKSSNQFQNYEIYENSLQKQNNELYFYNKLIKKNSFIVQQEIQNIQIFSERKGTMETNFFTLIKHNESLISIYDLAGKPYIENFDTEHKIYLITSFNVGDETLIGTLGEDNKMKIFTLIWKKKEESKKNNEMKFSIDKIETVDIGDYVDVKLAKEFIFYMLRGFKFILIGDQLGNVSIFTRNGTYRQTVALGDEVVGFIRHHLYVIYATKKTVGFINPTIKITTPTVCDEPYGQIRQIESDQISNNIIYLLMENQDILIYEMKAGADVCKKIQILTTNLPGIPSLNPKIYVSKNYVFYQASETSQKLRIFNVSDVNFETGEYENFDVELHSRRFSNNSNLNYIFQKNTHNSFFIIALETNSTDLKLEVTSYELLIPSKKTSDFLSNIRGPLIIVAVVAILLYQLFFRKKKENTTSNAKGSKGFGNTKGGLGGISEDETQKLKNYEETFKKLNSKTSELTKSLEKMKTDTGKFSELEEQINSFKKSL